MMNSLKDTDYTCRGQLQGFKVIFHNPGDIPRFSKHYLHLSLKKDATVILKANLVTTSNELLSYTPERRQCFFNDEKFLKFFNVYTQSNCELECLANFTLNYCGCVQFLMPRDNQAQLCSQKPNWMLQRS